MKIIHTADWHLGKIVNDYSMIDDQTYILEEMVKQTAQLKPDLFIIAGDLYDRSAPSGETVALASKVLTELRDKLDCPIIIIRGNHDSAERLAYMADFMAAQDIYITSHLSAQPQRLDLKGADLYIFPFVELSTARRHYQDENLKSYEDVHRRQLEDIKFLWRDDCLNIAVAHNSFTPGGEEQVIRKDSERPLAIGALEYTDVSLFSHFDYLALGHYHQAQRIGNERARYAGSILKYSKSEAYHQKKFLEINLDSENFEVIDHYLKPKYDLTVKKGYFEELLKEPSDDYVFIELEDEQPIMDVASQLRPVYPRLMGLEYLNRQPVESLDHDHRLIKEAEERPIDLFNHYFEEIKGRKPNEKQLEFIKEAFDQAMEGEDQ